LPKNDRAKRCSRQVAARIADPNLAICADLPKSCVDENRRRLRHPRYFDPHLALRLDGVTEILHAGDVGPQEVLHQFSTIAPVQPCGATSTRVRWVFRPRLRALRGVEIHLMHELPKSQSALRDWARAEPLAGKQAERCNQFLRSFPEECQVVVFGHTHEPCSKFLRQALLQPGQRRPETVFTAALLRPPGDVARGVRATILSLERYNEDLPGDVWLPLGGP